MNRPSNIDSLEEWCKSATGNKVAPGQVLQLIEYIRYLENNQRTGRIIHGDFIDPFKYFYPK
jgi:hypothetical protein